MERNIYIYIYFLYYFYTLRKKRDEFKVMNKSVILEGSKVKLYNCMFFNWNFLSISTQFGQKWKCGPSWFIFFPISLPFYLSNSENPTFFFFLFSSLLISLFQMQWATASVSVKVFFYFTLKIYFFLYYTPIFTKHSRYPIYSAHLFNKIFILLQFFIISSLTTLSLTYPILQKKILKYYMHNFTPIDVGVFNFGQNVHISTLFIFCTY